MTAPPDGDSMHFDLMRLGEESELVRHVPLADSRAAREQSMHFDLEVVGGVRRLRSANPTPAPLATQANESDAGIGNRTNRHLPNPSKRPARMRAANREF